ncbi:hypothetical protein BLL52_4142 [Rhodoferax antarcticus ANT.BR]|uniref:Uncharacterized protein n=2 Tax=Rhodoferax antarcticus TaxID=81479 RepID=A0A1Q8Y943_9BURK|nr:hypothetical protein BLL52_4142 [Rhodoferax antarcticus ANT.BR]
MFKSTDGQLHATNAECLQHDARLKAESTIKALAVEHIQAQGEEDLASIPDQLTKFVLQHSETLFAILAPMQTPRNRVPRKTKGSIKGDNAATAAAAVIAAAAVV